jgi:RND superfamily putative drug exporter
VPTSATSQAVVDRVLRQPAPFPVAVAGSAAVNHDVAAALRSRFALAAALMAVTTLAVLFAMTRSVLLPVKSLVMTVVTLTATAGLLVTIFQDGGLADVLDFQLMDHLNQANAVILFFIVFGLSTDYGVFLIARIKEAHDAGHDNREAVALGLERSGRIVTAAALLFCVAVGVSAIAQVRLVKEFGVGAALAVLIDATIIRALLVPALMALFGRANWWAPRFLRPYDSTPSSSSDSSSAAGSR